MSDADMRFDWMFDPETVDLRKEGYAVQTLSQRLDDEAKCEKIRQHLETHYLITFEPRPSDDTDDPEDVVDLTQFPDTCAELGDLEDEDDNSVGTEEVDDLGRFALSFEDLMSLILGNMVTLLNGWLWAEENYLD